MTDWFRSWHGAPTDPKWVLIGRKASCPPAVASAIAWALFDHASQASQRGSVKNFDCEVYAAWGGLDDAVVIAAVEAMRDRGMIDDVGMLAAWGKRQPEREDGSAERAKAWRERNRSKENAEITTQTQSNAIERNRPTDTDTDTDTEKKEEDSSLRSDNANKKSPMAENPETASKPEKPPKRKSRLAADCQPTPADLEHAATNAIDPRREWPKFRDYHAGRGTVMVDWGAAWRTWCRNSVEFSARASPAMNGYHGTSPEKSVTSAAKAHLRAALERENSDAKPTLLAFAGQSVRGDAGGFLPPR